MRAVEAKLCVLLGQDQTYACIHVPKQVTISNTHTCTPDMRYCFSIDYCRMDILALLQSQSWLQESICSDIWLHALSNDPGAKVASALPGTG